MTLSLIPLLLLTAPNLISGQAIPVGAEAGRGPLAAEAIVSRPIGTAHMSEATVADWNGDGLPDLLVGTPRHGSVPTPDRGLPQSLGLPGSSVLVLLNNGATGEPRFQWPKLVTFNDEPIFLGQHACGPTPAPFDEDAPADLAVGTEDGRLLFYAREDLGLVSAGLLKDRS